jgi:hypothetical protein
MLDARVTDEIGMIALRQPITPRRTRVLPTSQAAIELAPSRDGELIGAQMPGHAVSATHASHFSDGTVAQNVSAYSMVGIVDIAAVESRWHTHTCTYRHRTGPCILCILYLCTSMLASSIIVHHEAIPVPSAIGYLGATRAWTGR